MSISHQQYLNSDNLKTIESALARVRAVYGFKPGSDEERRVGAVMIGEFQLGTTSEDALFDVFLGATEPTLHDRRKEQTRQALQRREGEANSQGRPSGTA